MATGNAPRGFPRILQWLLAGLMLIIGLAVGILGAKLAPRRRYTVLRADGRGHGHRGGVDFSATAAAVFCYTPWRLSPR